MVRIGQTGGFGCFHLRKCSFPALHQQEMIYMFVSFVGLKGSRFHYWNSVHSLRGLGNWKVSGQATIRYPSIGGVDWWFGGLTPSSF